MVNDSHGSSFVTGVRRKRAWLQTELFLTDEELRFCRYIDLKQRTRMDIDKAFANFARFSILGETVL